MARRNFAKEAAEQFEASLAAEAKESEVVAESDKNIVADVEKVDTVVSTDSNSASVVQQNPVNAPAGELFDNPVAPAVADATVAESAVANAERELELERLLLEEKAKFQQLTMAQQAQLEQVTQELNELREFKAAVDFERRFNLDGVQLESLDDQAVRELTDKVLKPMLQRTQEEYQQQLRKTQQQLEEERAERLRWEAQRTEQQKAQQLEAMNRKITQAHPDFMSIRETAAFKQFLAQPVRAGSNITMAQTLGHEYHNGNVNFVIQALNEFKQARPDLSSVAAAGVNMTAVVPAVTNTEPVYSYNDLEKLNVEFAKGIITRDEYIKRKQAFDKAEAEGRIK